VNNAVITIRTLALAVSIAAATLAHQACATVIWSFYETGVSCSLGRCELPSQPFVLITLALPGPTSSGTARWRGSFTPPPVFTGDDFTLDWRFGQLSPAFTGNGCDVLGSGPRTICNFDIAWSASPSGLAISIFLHSFSDDIGAGPGFGSFGSFGGPIASDFELGGCIDTSCSVTGFWQSDLSVPEPMSILLLLSALLGACLTRCYRSRRSTRLVDRRRGMTGRRRRKRWCPGAELNHRHTDFQSVALPTELPGRFGEWRL
jgi:hypothetical protein